ncbi:MAG TPA: YciI family protein [Candidatus Baltobacteraceae bacterium]|nr:YciI family protein [Candidatus Baltobacteraceae bacterium]
MPPFSRAVHKTKELVGGFWMVQGKSREEVVERFMHAPFRRSETIEIRRVVIAEDFAEFATPEMIEHWERV